MDKWKSKGKYAKVNNVLDIIGIVLVIGLVVMTFIYWVKAPEIVPTHFNFKGEVDAYGSKNTLFIFLPITVIMYVALAIMAKYPQIYNYAIEINPRNKEKQYSMATTFIRVINVEMVSIFFYIQINIGGAMNKTNSNLSTGFLPISLIILFGSIGFYIYKSMKCK